MEKGFKSKTFFCQDCKHKNEIPMQAGVDNAITVEVFRRYIDGEQTKHKLKTVVLLTGDGDFLDLADMFKERLRINFFIASFKSSMNEELIGSVGEENILYLDHFDFKKEELKPSQVLLSRRMMSKMRFSLTRDVD